MTFTLAYLRHHWGDVYSITQQGGIWTAVARFGDRETLTAGSADELSGMIWRHYVSQAGRLAYSLKATGVRAVRAGRGSGGPETAG